LLSCLILFKFYILGDCSQLDLKPGNWRWNKSFSQTSLSLSSLGVWSMAPNLALYEDPVDTLPRSVKIICLWFAPTGYVKELTLFLPGLTLLKSPRTKYLVPWLVFIRFVGQVCHQWHTSAIPLKTSQPCDVIQEDLQIYTSQVNGSTTLQLHNQLPSSFY
jgi:hypothetical protein